MRHRAFGKLTQEVSVSVASGPAQEPAVALFIALRCVWFVVVAAALDERRPEHHHDLHGNKPNQTKPTQTRALLVSGWPAARRLRCDFAKPLLMQEEGAPPVLPSFFFSSARQARPGEMGKPLRDATLQMESAPSQLASQPPATNQVGSATTSARPYQASCRRPAGNGMPRMIRWEVEASRASGESLCHDTYLTTELPEYNRGCAAAMRCAAAARSRKMGGQQR